MTMKTYNSLIQTNEVAKRLGVSRQSVLHYYKQGILPGVQFTPGGWIWYRPEDIEKFRNEGYASGITERTPAKS